MAKADKKLLFVVAEDSYFCSHRLNLAKKAQNNGYSVALASCFDKHLSDIQALGIKTFPLTYFNRASTNIFKEPLALKELYSIYKEFKPDIVHHVALKPVLYGTFLARLLKITVVINALGGLGFLFTDSGIVRSNLRNLKKGLLKKIICACFRVLFNQKNVFVVLQNKYDEQTLILNKCIPPKKAIVIPGSGINTHQYPFTEEPEVYNSTLHSIKIVCVSRLLWDKGIGEFINAARILKKEFENTLPLEFILWGEPDPKNPATIALSDLKQWQDEGIVSWMGFCKDVASAYRDSHIAVLPSYREGLPKSLLEASSCGRPIITTDVPGCKDIIHYCKNGFLVPAQNVPELIDALKILIQYKDLRKEMGLRGHQNIERFFNEDLIHQQFLVLYGQHVHYEL